VHVEDVCSAYVAVLEAPREAVHNQAFNVGQSAENYQIRDIANVVPEVVPESRVEYANESRGDSRTYRVDFGKISDRLPGFKTRWNIRRGAEQLYRWCKEQRLDLDRFQSRSYTRLAQVEHLLNTGRVDGNLLWRTDGRP
jgi:nucleoside-diphosphate-sugar epimerase